MDLALLKLDLMVCINVDGNGLPSNLYYAHILPQNIEGLSWNIEQRADIGRLNINFLEFIRDLENEFGRTAINVGLDKRERAFLVNVTTSSKKEAEESLKELEELAVASDLLVVDSIIQKKKEVDSRFILGKGKLSEIVIRSLQLGADLLIFDSELTPAQVRLLTNYTEMKIIDRSQLILDIFARRAVTKITAKIYV